MTKARAENRCPIAGSELAVTGVATEYRTLVDDRELPQPQWWMRSFVGTSLRRTPRMRNGAGGGSGALVQTLILLLLWGALAAYVA